MAEKEQSYQQLKEELEELKYQLDEARDTIEAIRSGEIDALVINGDDGHQIYTLKSADQTYRIFIEQMTQGAITIDENGKILYSNSQFALLINQPLEKVIGQSFFNYIAKDNLPICIELIDSAWENVLTKGELKLATSQYEIPVLLSLKTLDLDEGVSLSIILTDLTEQKINQKLLEDKNRQLQNAEQTARELNINLEETVKIRTLDLEQTIAEKSRVSENLFGSEQRLSKILETMAEGVLIVDVNNQVTYANKMAQQLLGIKENVENPSQYLNSRWETFKLDGTPLSIDENPIYVAMQKGKAVFDYEIAVQIPNDGLLYIAFNAVPLYDENNLLTGGLGTFIDVTQRRKSIQQKDDFISVASHELKTPITSLKASLQLLNRIKENPTDKLPSLIDQANKSMTKVSNLIEELLNASKITSGQMHLNLVDFKLISVVNDCLQNILPKDKAKIKVTGDLDLSVHGDPNRIEQVVINFVNNAIKYAAQSETIEIKIIDEVNTVKLMVLDNGPGISAEKLPHLFDRYYRIDEGGFQYSGLGLGLYISSEIIKRNNGEIGAESKVGAGSTFWFSLPKASSNSNVNSMLTKNNINFM